SYTNYLSNVVSKSLASSEPRTVAVLVPAITERNLVFGWDKALFQDNGLLCLNYQLRTGFERQKWTRDHPK
ncbi:MAG TPA: hypothetical protein PKD64_17740, partial [Pirellulaceae bacterium]|nr:hypothetical protein [Pirellulaceae bacterium]HMO94031.1 hypothetical protein [Pirellulaceae bacterium]HMP70901.1 hypothetical protein [Pirellulaceae bacterium]